VQTVLAGLVLAAGQGRRMGGPKALLELEREPLVRRHVQRLAEVGCVPQVVVAPSAWADAVRGLLSGSCAHVVAGDPASQSASVALGLTALLTLTGLSPAQLTVLITPVDLLPARVDTLRMLVSALEPHGLAITPRHGGRGGHPVLVRGSLLARLRMADPPSLRELLGAAGARRSYVDVADPRVLGDLDTPEQAAQVGVRFSEGEA
jgi:molybdenum cofactor cytidylyltransferase